jgi:octaprenyl-diphosphate synthase
MSAACELGALSGPTEHRAALARFGRDLGMAFQVVDDLLDYTADEAELGKPAGLDLREHKVTLPLIAVLPSLTPTERGWLEEFFREPEPEEDAIAGIIQLVRERGGLDYAREKALAYARSAAEALDGLPEGPALSALRDSIIYAVERRR